MSLQSFKLIGPVTHEGIDYYMREDTKEIFAGAFKELSATDIEALPDDAKQWIKEITDVHVRN